VRFDAELKKLIEQDLIRLHEELGSGMAIKTIDQYRERVGEIRAYNKVVDQFFGEAQTKLNTE
jgi:hypothetical protein